MKSSALLAATILVWGTASAWAGAGALTFKDGDVGGTSFAPTVTKGAADQPIGQISLEMSTNDTLTGIKVVANGTRTGLSNFKMWVSTDNALGGDIVSSNSFASDPGDNVPMDFVFSNSLTGMTTYYCFLTADVASNATGQVRASMSPFPPNIIYVGGGYAPSGFLSTANVPLPVALSRFSVE